MTPPVFRGLQRCLFLDLQWGPWREAKRPPPSGRIMPSAAPQRLSLQAWCCRPLGMPQDRAAAAFRGLDAFRPSGAPAVFTGKVARLAAGKIKSGYWGKECVRRIFRTAKARRCLLLSGPTWAPPAPVQRVLPCFRPWAAVRSDRLAEPVQRRSSPRCRWVAARAAG